MEHIHNIMCDNAISKQIRHILSHNFHSVQFIPVMLCAFVATLVRVFYLYATNSLFYGLFFSVFFSFLHDQAFNVSLHIIIIIHKDKTNFSFSYSRRNYRTNVYISFKNQAFRIIKNWENPSNKNDVLEIILCKKINLKFAITR